MPKVSVIVPVYNTEKYLPRCIDSILTQTFTDFELILVNDGSTDNSGKICDEYAEKDSRIVVAHKENEGANAARKEGVNIASGEWINFVDSDDTITSNSIELLINNTSDNIDIVIGQIFKTKRCAEILSYFDYRKKILTGKMAHPVAKLYRRKILIEEIFDLPKKITIGEDMLMNVRLAFTIRQNVKVVPNLIYNYRYRANSAINSRKHSIEYEILFWKQLKKAIPTNEINEYNEELFYHVFTQWKKFCEYKINPPKEWYESELSEYLLINFSKYKASIPFINRVLIKSNNTFFRFFLISLKKINNRLHFAR